MQKVAAFIFETIYIYFVVLKKDKHVKKLLPKDRMSLKGIKNLQFVLILETSSLVNE